METGTFYPYRYHIPVCLLLVFLQTTQLISLVVFIWQIPRGGKCLLLPVTGYAHAFDFHRNFDKLTGPG